MTHQAVPRDRIIVVAWLLSNAIFPVVSLVPSQVSLVTWNLLAPHFALPSKYPWADEGVLDWDKRESLIVEELTAIDADIICLQEVQVDLWDHLCSLLDGYDGVFQNMTRDHPVANAILVKRGGLKIIRTESRSRALIAVLVDETESSSPLYLANAHLEAGCGDASEVTRFNQVRSLCKRLYVHVHKDPDKKSNDAPAIVITGDCNMLRFSPVYTFLKTGSFQDARGVKIKAPCLPLRDAYLEHPPPWGPKALMSYRSGHLLDYVWVSDSIKVLRTMPVKDAVSTGGQKEWPSADNPSDHIPIGAILSWPGASLLERKDRPKWQQLTD